MKTKYWVLLLAMLLVFSGGLSVFLLRSGQGKGYVEVWSDGKLQCTLSLDTDRQITVTSKTGTNVITVRDGKVAVTDADCADHICINRGFCSGGADIVCLPNRLVLRFVDDAGMDGVAG